MHVIVPVYGIHHDPDYWPDPGTYNPDRFSSDNSDKHHLYAFLGFGDGPRQCIGMQFAILQLKITLATILKDWSVSLSNKSEGTVTIAKNKLSLMPKSKIWLRLDKVKGGKAD
jgi:cytochrome P450 family 6